MYGYLNPTIFRHHRKGLCFRSYSPALCSDCDLQLLKPETTTHLSSVIPLIDGVSGSGVFSNPAVKSWTSVCEASD